MGFHDVLFPTDISYRSSGGPGFNTEIIVLPGGGEERVERWSRPQYTFDVVYDKRAQSVVDVLVAFFNARRGAANTFRFRHQRDQTSASDGRSDPSDTDQVIGVGDASETVFQLKKTYTSGSESTERLIKAVQDGTVVCALDGTPEAGFTVNNTTGEVTFDSAPGSGVEVTAGFKFDVPVRFGTEIDKHLPIAHTDPGTDSVDGTVQLIEDVDPTPVWEEVPSRGAKYLIIPSPVHAIGAAEALVWDVVADVTNRGVLLPNPADLPPGGVYFYIRNAGVNDADIRDQSGIIKTIATGVTGTVLLTVDASGDKAWIVV